MATMTLTFDVPETKIFDMKAFQQKVTDLIQFVIKSLPEREMDETEYIMSNPQLMAAIKAGDEEIERGNLQSINVEDLWK